MSSTEEVQKSIIDSIPEFDPHSSLNGNDSDSENSENKVEEKKNAPIIPPSINDESAFPALGNNVSLNSSPVSWGPAMKAVSASNVSTRSTGVAKKSSVSRSKNVQEAFNINNAVSLNISKVEFAKIINELKKNHQVSVESTVSSVTKNRSFIVTGKEADVIKVKKELVRRLTKPVQITFNIPAKTRSAIIGAGGRNLKPIIESSGTKINIQSNAGTPAGDDDLDDQIQVTVDGDVDGVNEAKQKILAIVAEETKNLTTRVQVPDHIVRFVAPYEVSQEDLTITGPTKNGFIILSGLRETVLVQKSKIIAHLQDLEGNLQTEVKSIPKQVHPFIDPAEIFTRYEVVVEIPEHGQDVAFIGLQKNISGAIQYARTATSQYVIDSLDISKAHGGKVEHAKNIAAYFTHSGILKAVAESTNTKISGPSYSDLATDLKSVIISFSAKKEAASGIKEARKEIIANVNKLTPSQFRVVADVGTFYSKKIAHETASAAKASNVHVVPLSALSDGKTNLIILVALDNAEDEFAPSQEEIDARLDAVNKSLDGIRALEADLKTEVLDVQADKQQFIEGPKGTTLKTLLNQVQNAVVVKLHHDGTGKSEDKVFIEGTKSDVLKVVREIETFLKDAENIKDINSFKIESSVPTQVIPRLIGKNGANLNTLREEFGVQVDVEKNPVGEKASITITGYKYNVQEAEQHILQASRRWADETVQRFVVAQKYQPALLGPNGAYVKKLQTKYNVRIQLDREKNEAVIRGPSRGVAKAEEELKELLDFEIENGYTKELQIPAKAIAFVIGRGRETLNRISADTNVEINITRENEDEKEEFRKLSLTGSRTGLKQAETAINAIVKEAQDTISIELNVDPKYYKIILGSRGRNKADIIEKAGGSEYKNYSRLLQIPDVGSESQTITSSGPKKIVDSIVEQINKIVNDRENSVTEIVDVPKSKRKLIIGVGGATRQELENEFSVQIDIPRADSDSSDVKVIGLPENIQKAKAKISELTADNWKAVVDVPAYLHSAVSERGAFTRKLRIEGNVEIDFGDSSRRAFKLSSGFPTPPETVNGTDDETFKFTVVDGEVEKVSRDENDVISWRLIGSDEDVKKAESQINGLIAKFSKDDLSAFLWVKDRSVFGKIVGPQGSRINSIRNKSGAQIYIPRNNDKVNNVIYLKGTKSSLEKAEKLLRSEIKN